MGSSEADCDARTRDAAHVVSGRFRVQRQMASPIEARGIVAFHDRATAQLTVWTSTQVPHHVREDLADTLAMPLHAVRVIAPSVGGGFGPKDHLYPDEVMVCVAAGMLGVPVKWVEQRSEHAHATVHARDQVQFATLALDADGRFIALDARIIVDLGAQTTNVGGGPAFSTAALLEGPYRFDDSGTTVVGALTNKTPSGAYRGFGQGEAAWVRERLIDEAARVMGRCPIELRRQNMISSGDMPFVTHSAQSYDSGDYAAALDRAAEILAKPRTGALPDPPHVRRGTGVASYVQFAGSATGVARNINFRIAGYETVVLRMEPDGTVMLHTGVSPHGQGLETTLAQVTADRLGVPLKTVHVVVGDTSSTPPSAGTIASRSMMLGGGAAIGAATALRAKLLHVAAHRLEVATENLELHEGVVSVVGSPTISVPVAELARAAWLGWDLPTGISRASKYVTRSIPRTARTRMRPMPWRSWSTWRPVPSASSATSSCRTAGRS